MKSKARQVIGQKGESIAADYLEKKGYIILERNFRTPYGEIDLICKQANVIIFVEVKSRTNRSLGPPEISITSRKAGHLRGAAEYFIQQHPELTNDWRIDAVTILIGPDNSPPSIDHFENIIG